MKDLNLFVTEKLHVDKNIETDKYSSHPKNKSELIEILYDRLSEEGSQDLNDIDVSEITDMSYLFKDLAKYIEIIDVSEWDISNVKNMEGMFWHCNKFDCDLRNWDVSNVTDMFGMFLGCENFKGNGLENWDVSNCGNFKSMFYDCKNFNANIEEWNVENGTDFRYMFGNCKKFNRDVSDWGKTTTKLSREYSSHMFRNSGVKKLPEWYRK